MFSLQWEFFPQPFYLLSLSSEYSLKNIQIKFSEQCEIEYIGGGWGYRAVRKADFLVLVF